MVRNELLRASEIRRRDTIPQRDRTEDRDAAAEIIEDKWPATLTDIADSCDYSRQHIATVLETYFEPVQTEIDAPINLPITVPEDGEITLQFEITIKNESKD